MLTLGRYVGAEEVEDDSTSFEEKMAQLTTQLSAQFSESAKLEEQIRTSLSALAYKL